MRSGAGPNHFRLSKCCEVHKAFAVARAQFDVWPQLVSSMIAFAISQRAAGALDLLRECAVVFFKCRLKFVSDVRPPPHCKVQLALMLPWMFRGPDTGRRSVIETFLNGDWSDSDPQHYHCWDCTCKCKSGEDAGAFIEDSLVPSIMRTLVRLFPRHRWTGAEAILGDTLRMTAPHQLINQIGPVSLSVAMTR
jgi:hypothetical protein